MFASRRLCLHSGGGAEEQLPKVPSSTLRSTGSTKITILGVELGTHARRVDPGRSQPFKTTT
jgi:hypothetical protein